MGKKYRSASHHFYLKCNYYWPHPETEENHQDLYRIEFESAEKKEDGVLVDRSNVLYQDHGSGLLKILIYELNQTGNCDIGIEDSNGEIKEFKVKRDSIVYKE